MREIRKIGGTRLCGKLVNVDSIKYDDKIM